MGFNAFPVSGVTWCDFTTDDPVWSETMAKDGAISIPLSLGGAEGRLFLACDHELGALAATVKRVGGGGNGQDVRCPSQVECTGKTGVSPVCGKGGVEVTVMSPDKDVMVPIRVEGVGKKPFYGVVKKGVWRHVFTEAGDIRVTNLADGAQAAPLSIFAGPGEANCVRDWFAANV